MESINISKRKFEGLKKLDLPEEVISTEANFYIFNYLGKTKVFKSLLKNKGPVFANKLFTLEMLNEYREILPENFVIPESLVTVEKEVKGFALPYIKGFNLDNFLANKNISNKDKILYIKKIGLLLDKMDHIRKESGLDSLYLNDLHASNFIVDTDSKELKVVDLDSCRICDAKPFPARYLNPLSLLTLAPGDNKYDIYRKELIDEKGNILMEVMSEEEDKYSIVVIENCYELIVVSYLYCYVILFLNFLYGSNISLFSLNKFYDYINYLEKLGYDRNLINAIIRIVTGAPNENIGFYLDGLNDEMIARANKKVYEATRERVLNR